MSGYTKLFNSIVSSTIWQEDMPTRIVWITMLAMSDKDGVVEGSVPGLAHISRVSIEECERALEKFQQPDKYSRTPDNDGRRIEVIDGGWLILNRAKYRDTVPDETRREKDRERQRKHRELSRVTNVTERDNPHLSLQKEEEKETKKEKELKPDGPRIIFRIATSHPKLSHLKNEAEIPHVVADAIIQAIAIDGEDLVLSGTRGWAETVDDPKYSPDPYKFFSQFKYRTEAWKRGDAKPSRIESLLATVSEISDEPGGYTGPTGNRQGSRF